jgi:hypothetical protein
MTDSDFDDLRAKAREKIKEGFLPATTKDVDNVTADAQHRGSSCALCGNSIAGGEFLYRLYDSSKTPVAVHRHLHFQCHAAWQCEVIARAIRQ